MAAPRWKLFQFTEIREAEAYAAAGGIAVHLSGDWIPPGRTSPTPCAHVFGPDRETLTREITTLGMKPAFTQYPDDPKRMHFDVWSSPLARAKLRCKADILPPATLFDPIRPWFCPACRKPNDPGDTTCDTLGCQTPRPEAMP